MATLDIAILVVIGLSAVIGMVRGFVKEVLSLLSWASAFFLAIYFSPQLAQMLPPSWGADSVRLVIAFALAFVGVLVATSILQWVIGKLVDTTGLSGTDRLLGFLFGSARGILICIVALIGLREVANETSWWQASRLQVELLAFEDDVRGLMGQAQELVRELPIQPGNSGG